MAAFAVPSTRATLRDLVRTVDKMPAVALGG
jgi:hypothetical protein